jgi:titin
VVEDRTLLSTFIVTNTADTGPGSLRQAILDSDSATGQTNTIDFAIPGTGVETITPVTSLPSITQAVLIDGWSQPAYAGTPLIQIDGSQAGGGDDLTITGSNATVRGLDISNFNQGAGIRITGAGATGSWIYGNFLGTDPYGTQAAPNNEGVEIDGGATQNLVGSNGDGVNDAPERDLLSGNLFAGVWISGQGKNCNAVAGNFIGTDITGKGDVANGTQPVFDNQGNAFGGGVAISDGASGNRIGTDGKSVDDAGERNVIAGSSSGAIDIYGTGTDGNVVAGNFIGTDVSGARSLFTGFAGVLLADGASSNWIGVNPLGGQAFADEGNVISGCTDGILITGSARKNVIAGNKIGTDVTGAVGLGNYLGGVEIDSGCAGNTIGGTTADAGNLISANGRCGVEITGTGASGNLVQGNAIRGNATTATGYGVASSGIEIVAGASDNTIGGAADGAGNVITSNGGPGVVVGSSSGDACAGDQVTANRIYGNAGQAIDLMDDGVTYNSATPRTGPNNLQNFPIIVTTPGGGLPGWLGGSQPNTTFRVDVFASVVSQNS